MERAASQCIIIGRRRASSLTLSPTRKVSPAAPIDRSPVKKGITPSIGRRR